MATVRWESASKWFGRTAALRDFSLAVEDGEFLVLVGPSGSGKTTALRLLAGLDSISAGHVWIGDRIVDRLAPQERKIAMVFQDYALYPQMSVSQNMGFGLRMANVPRQDIERQVAATAHTLGIGELLERKPRELSGGQRQRVALARALVRQPQVFLMDEPLSNLDAQLRAQTRGEIKRLQKDVRITTVYVTHDQVEAMTMGDRVAVMRDGVLQQVGPPGTVYDQPANVFVASFIGSPAMSLNALAAERRGGSLTLRRDTFSLELSSFSRDVPSTVTLGVRPEQARLWDGAANLVGPFGGTVESIEELGRESFVSVVTPEGLRFVLLVDGSFSVAIDQRLSFGLRSGQLHLFDGETGHALVRI